MIASVYSFAGAAQAELNCISSSGKTKITGWVPGDSDDSMLKISINNEIKTIYNNSFKEFFDNNDRVSIEEEYPNGSLSEITVVNAIEKNTFTLVIDPNGKRSELYSHGKTVAYTKIDYGYKASFKATLYGFFINLFPNQKLPYSIDLNCSLKYSL